MTEHKRTYRLQDSLPTFDQHCADGELRTHRKSILVVEDEEDLNHALSCRLRKAGFHVVSSFDALSGLQQTGYHKPDLVLIDLVLPDLKASGFLGEFLELKRMKSVPVILMTMDRNAVVEQDAHRYGITAILEKPISHITVTECIAELLDVELPPLQE